MWLTIRPKKLKLLKTISVHWNWMIWSCYSREFIKVLISKHAAIQWGSQFQTKKEYKNLKLAKKGFGSTGSC